VPKNIEPSMADIIAEVAKKFEVKVGSLSTVVSPVEALTTGNLAIDYLTGVGGLPIGRVTECYGQPSSGKTTTALQAAAELQKRIIDAGSDERILYMDFEHALDEDYAGGLGLDVEHPTFLLAQPYWLEQGAEAARKIIESGKVRLSIWDSVAEMTPKSVLDSDFDRRTGAMERARQIKELLFRLTPLINHKRCAAVFLNHAVEAVDMGGGRPGMPPPETTPGGKALKFYASLRMSYRQIKQVKGKQLDALTGEITDQVIAVDTKVKVTKNKLANPFREAVVRVRFGRGFDNVWSALQVLTAYKKVTIGTGGYYFFDEKKVPELVHTNMATSSSTGRPSIHGEAAVLRFADDHPEWREQIIKIATAVVESAGDSAVPAAEPVDAFADDLNLLGGQET
jgi:recombination protein RecA